ncbi:GNAT family N-acetyltransferase [Salinibaculum rarum]|uniref:GNAT family N-acetyltransferase n=1 Tax=Salinibaculum rarum TaxID=3058903 RepID=UPI00265DD122|nr:GNAT family N-acetyltransferase [Salinibaculum sp. KK48]
MEYETSITDAIVRTADPDDADDIMSLWNGYADTLIDFDERFEIEDGGREKWQDYFTTSLVNSSRGDILLAERDDTAIGALEARVIGGHPVFNFGKHGMVYGHYVHPEFRGEGVGRALLEAAEEWFQDKEMPFWRIEVLHGVAEEELYQEYGMKPMEVTYEKEL